VVTHAERLVRAYVEADGEWDDNELITTVTCGPPGRMILFNSAPERTSSIINIGWAEADWVDWNSNFDDRQPWPYAERMIDVGINEDSFFDIQNADWVDQTALGDLVFANGFELGSTTAWSETVP